MTREMQSDAESDAIRAAAGAARCRRGFEEVVAERISCNPIL